jgi:amino-acid N-acetyltransferase
MNIVFYKPKVSDIPAMQKIVHQEIINGIILLRDDNDVATNIRSYTVVKVDNKIVGFAALHIHTPTLAEIRSLVIQNDYRSKGIGHKLVNQTIQEAISLDIKEILVLTYRDSFFKQFGFKIIDKESIPHPKIWADCIKCQHFPKCDEIALIKSIR